MAHPTTGAARRYDLLAIDLDGTLFDSRGCVSDRNVEMIHAAREAGIVVCVCTGRGLVESRRAIERIGQTDAVIVAGGAITACPASGRTLHRFAMRPDTVIRAVEAFHAAGHAALVLKNAPVVGYDYLVLGGPDGHSLDPVTAWWFENNGVSARFASRVDDDEHPDETVRVGVCADEHTSVPLARTLTDTFGPETNLHSFPAVVSAAVAGGDRPRRVHVLEVFDRRANKWAAIERLARERGIGPERVAAIGDEVNDVPMIRGAGLGIAMANAVDAVLDEAARVTRSNDDDGVADAIGRILGGEW